MRALYSLTSLFVVPTLAHQHAPYWKDVGCYSPTTLSAQQTIQLKGEATAQVCQELCDNYKYAGVVAGKGECVCADKMEHTKALSQDTCDCLEGSCQPSVQVYKHKHFHKDPVVPVEIEMVKLTELLDSTTPSSDGVNDDMPALEDSETGAEHGHHHHHSQHHCHRHHRHLILASFSAFALVLLIYTWRRRRQFIQLDVESGGIAPYNHQYKSMALHYDYPGYPVQPMMQQKQ